MNDDTPRTPAEALTLALTLAITALTDEQAQACLEMADTLAAQLSPQQVEACKAASQIAASGVWE